MTQSIRVPIKREIWKWALEEGEKEELQFIGRFPIAEKWLNQELMPTLKQLESVAKYLQIPLGYLFLDTPPKEDVMDVEFRSISNKIPRVSKNLKDVILEMDLRKSWMSDYRKDLGWDKLDVIRDFNEQKIEDTVADSRLAKKLLDLSDDWHTQARDLDHAFRILKEKLEDVGIIVMRNGIVRGNTRRSLDINEFRAFLLYDDVAPLIFINNNDSKAGRVFSLIHEYFHVLFELEDVVLDPFSHNNVSERKINTLTAEFLMPQAEVLTAWNKHGNVSEQIQVLSRYFKVSRLSLAIRLNSLGLINQRVVEKIKSESIQDFKKKENDGGRPNFYTTYYSRMSPTFLETVIRSAESGEIGYTYAFKLLGVTGKTFDQIKTDVMPYG